MRTILGIIVLLAGTIASDDKDFNLFDRHCVGKLNGYKYQSPHDCSEFYTCMNEGAWMDMCPDGLYFDEKLQDCEEPKNVVCHQIQALPACTSQSAGAVVQHDDCTKFYICNGNIWKTGQCEDGLSFVREKGVCQWLQNEQCPEAIFRRNLVLSDTNGQLFEKTHMDSRCAQRETQKTQHLAHPTSCSKFFKCYLGEAFLEQCPSGLHFSVALDRCEDIEVADCDIDRSNHNLMHEHEKKQKHKGKPQHVAAHTTYGAQYKPESEQKLPLFAVALPSNVKNNVEQPKEFLVAQNTNEIGYEVEESLEEDMNDFFNFLNSPNLLAKPNVDTVPIYTPEQVPNTPVMVLPEIPGSGIQSYEQPMYRPIEVVSVEPVPMQTMPMQPIRPMQPVRPVQPVYPEPIVTPVQPVNPIEPLPVQTFNPVQPVNPIEQLPVQTFNPDEPVNPIQPLPVLPEGSAPDQKIESPKKHKKRPKFENFKTEKEYFDSLFEYYYPSHSNPTGYGGAGAQIPDEQWTPVRWLGPKQQPQRRPHQQHKFNRRPHQNTQRPMHYQRYRDADMPEVPERGIPDGRCPWISDPLNPIHLPNPKDCTKFYKCFTGALYEHNCPEGLEWSSKLSRCDHPSIAKCVSEGVDDQPSIIAIEPAQAEMQGDEYEVGKPDPRCPRIEGKDVVHFEHPSECNKFYKCSFGFAYLINCPPGLHWARKLNRCDFKHVALCPYRYQL